MSTDFLELGWTDGSRMHIHGGRGPSIVVLHGGPAAVGSAAPMARELSDEFTVYEPWQRGSSDVPLTVARHVNDLHDLIMNLVKAANVALIGESWGAMLALAYAAAHPDSAGPLVLIGCGTFDVSSRARMKEVIEERTTEEMRNQLRRLERETGDEDKLLKKRYDMIKGMYDYDALESNDDNETGEQFDMKAHTETWNDMLSCQARGLYPESFRAIKTPVIMLHGAYDPHPGKETWNTLRAFIPHLEYREWEKCGHSPWSERHARDGFFGVMRQWLRDNLQISA